MNRKLRNELLSMDRAKLEEQYSYLIGQAEIALDISENVQGV